MSLGMCCFLYGRRRAVSGCFVCFLVTSLLRFRIRGGCGLFLS